MKRLLICAMAAGLLASLSACGSTVNAADSDFVYGQTDSVSGNDIVLLLADYNENADSGDADAAEETDSGKRSGESKREKPEGFDKSKFSGEMPEGFDPSNMPEGFSRSKKDGESDESGESKRDRPEGFDPSNMPEGFSRPKKDGESDESGESKRERPEGFDKSKFSGEMPEGFDPSNLPEGFEKPADGEMPEGFDESRFGDSRSKASSSRYTLTGEQEELRIAVGTTVTTALGVETDFDVLKSGDMIKCTVEKDSDGNDVITAVWILEE